MPNFHNATDTVVNDLVVKRDSHFLKYCNSGHFLESPDTPQNSNILWINSHGTNAVFFPDANIYVLDYTNDGYRKSYNQNKHIHRLNSMLFTHNVASNVSYTFLSDVENVNVTVDGDTKVYTKYT